MGEKELKKENILTVQTEKPSYKKITLIILLVLAVIIISLGISAYLYFKTPEKTLGIGANIEEALLSEDGEIAYIKLAGESDKNITKIKFIFTDAEGKNYAYGTSEGIKEISVPFKRGFWDWLTRKPKYEGKYDYEIKAEDTGLNDFNNINEVSVLFEYKTETNQTIITPPLDTTKPTQQNKTTTPSSGGGGGGGGPTPPTCTDSDGGINYYEKGITSYFSTTNEDYCNNSINTLTEYYCNGTNIEQINYDCSLEGKVCLDGRCLELAECTTNENCTDYNKLEIATCNNLFWDYAPENESICGADNKCIVSTQTIISSCNISCGAECETSSNCVATECDNLDGCVGNDYYDYNDISNNCLSNCSCESNSCDDFTIFYNDARCIGFCLEITECGSYTDKENCTVDSCGIVGSCKWNVTSRECYNYTGKVYYCDPNGNNSNDGSAAHPWGTLESAVAAGKFKYPTWVVASGDTVKLNAGFHGAPAFKNSVAEVKNQYTDYVTIEPNGTAVVELSQISFYQCAYYKIKGLRISPSLATPSQVKDNYPNGGDAAPRIISMYDTDHIIIEDCNLFTTMNVSGWDPYKWQYWAWNGIYVTYTSYNTYRNNVVRNVMFGMIAPPNSLVEGNLIDGFAGDGLDIFGPNIIAQDNKILNVYKHISEYPHNDGMQLWGDGSGLNVIIRRNYINGRTDPTRDTDSVGGLQGVFLEAVMTDSLIENNVVMALNPVWGITMWSAVNTKILNNTVLHPYGIGDWPDIVLEGYGGRVSSNAIVRNNIADNFPSGTGITADHNLKITNYNEEQISSFFVNYPYGDVRPLMSSPICNGSINLVGVAVGALECAPDCNDGETRECGIDVGRCQKGTEGCVSGKWGGICAGEITPITEICNNLDDDDCDGNIDIDCIPSYIPQGLISWWMFEGDITDSGPGGNNGIFYDEGISRIPTYVNRNFGQAIEFDGNENWVKIPNPNLVFTEGTVLLWFNTPNLETGSGTEDVLFKFGEVDEWAKIFWSASTFGDVAVSIDDGDGVGACGKKSISMTSKGVLNDSKWHQAVFTFKQGDNFRLYIDGKENVTAVSLASCLQEWNFNNEDWFISDSFDYNGSIDEVMIFNRALNETEIIEIYCKQGGKDLNPSFCVSYGFSSLSPFAKLWNFFKSLLTAKTGKTITGNAVNSNRNEEGNLSFIKKIETAIKNFLRE